MRGGLRNKLPCCSLLPYKYASIYVCVHTHTHTHMYTHTQSATGTLKDDLSLQVHELWGKLRPFRISEEAHDPEDSESPEAAPRQTDR